MGNVKKAVPADTQRAAIVLIRPAPANQNNLKILKKLWLAGEGSTLQGGRPLLFWSCESGYMKFCNLAKLVYFQAYYDQI